MKKILLAAVLACVLPLESSGVMKVVNDSIATQAQSIDDPIIDYIDDPLRNHIDSLYPSFLNKLKAYEEYNKLREAWLGMETPKLENDSIIKDRQSRNVSPRNGKDMWELCSLILLGYPNDYKDESEDCFSPCMHEETKYLFDAKRGYIFTLKKVSPEAVEKEYENFLRKHRLLTKEEKVYREYDCYDNPVDLIQNLPTGIEFGEYYVRDPYDRLFAAKI